MSLAAVIIAVCALLSTARDKRLVYDVQILQRVYELLGRLEANLREVLRSDKDGGLSSVRSNELTEPFDLELTALIGRLAGRKKHKLLTDYQEYIAYSFQSYSERVKTYEHVPFQSGPVQWDPLRSAREAFDAMAEEILPIIEGPYALTRDGRVPWRNDPTTVQELERLKLVKIYEKVC
jgi:hypothetical protein